MLLVAGGSSGSSGSGSSTAPASSDSGGEDSSGDQDSNDSATNDDSSSGGGGGGGGRSSSGASAMATSKKPQASSSSHHHPQQQQQQQQQSESQPTSSPERRLDVLVQLCPLTGDLPTSTPEPSSAPNATSTYPGSFSLPSSSTSSSSSSSVVPFMYNDGVGGTASPVQLSLQPTPRTIGEMMLVVTPINQEGNRAPAHKMFGGLGARQQQQQQNPQTAPAVAAGMSTAFEPQQPGASHSSLLSLGSSHPSSNSLRASTQRPSMSDMSLFNFDQGGLDMQQPLQSGLLRGYTSITSAVSRPSALRPCRWRDV